MIASFSFLASHQPLALRKLPAAGLWLRWLLRTACVCVLPLGMAPVYAQAANDAGIEEIVVTAEFRDASLNSTPVSASVIRPNDRGTILNHLEEALAQAPNVNFASGASRGRFVQIRGIGERGQFAEPLNSSVGLIIDGVDMSGIGTIATLFDVEQVEVLRGPQGTLYGANALAGLINVVTRAPSTEHTAKIRLDAGDFGMFGVGGVVSGPLSERVGYRFSAQRYRDDGFIENDFLNRENTNNRDERSFRGKVMWDLDATQWSLVFGRIDVDNGYDAFSLDNDRTTITDAPGRDEQLTQYAAISLRHDLGSVMLEGTLALADSDIDYGYDEDWTFDGFDPAGYVSTDRYLRDRQTQTLDVRLLSQPGQGFGAWDWVAGIYAFDQNVDLRRNYAFFPAPFDSSFEIERMAVYGEITRAFGDHYRLTMGARYERHEAEYDDTDGNVFDPRDDLFGGRLVLERTLADNSLLYASLSRGYKAGGFNQDGALPADLREFDPEELWNIELGYKARLLDERLTLRAALFRMDRRDIQISTSTTRPVDPLVVGGPQQFIEFTGNGAEGVNQGVELEATYQASPQLELFANIGYLDTEYKDFIDSSGRDLDGREQAQAPNYQFFAGAEYFFDERWSLRVEVEGKDEYFFSASHTERSDAYELFNVSLAYAADGWSARLWGRNLSDEDVFVRGFFFGNDPRDGYTERGFTQLGEPRQYGLSVSFEL